MPIFVRCTSCQKPYHAPEHLAGKQVKCRQCGSAIAVPTPQSSGVETGEDAWANLTGMGMDPGPIVDRLEATGSMPALQETPDESASEPPAWSTRWANRPLIYPGSRWVDRWLPLILVVGGIAWVILEGYRRNETGLGWIPLLRAGIIVGLYTLLIYPFLLLAVRKVSSRMNFALPEQSALRVYASFCPGMVLTGVMWSVGGGPGGAIVGAIGGLAISLGCLALLLRLRPWQMGQTLGWSGGTFVVGAVLAGGLIWGGNLLLLNILQETHVEYTLSESPIGVGLPWAPPNIPQEDPEPPPRRAPLAPVPVPEPVPVVPVTPIPTDEPVADMPRVDPQPEPVAVTPALPPEPTTNQREALGSPDEHSAPVVDRPMAPAPATPPVLPVVPPSVSADSPLLSDVTILRSLGEQDQMLHTLTPSPWLALIRREAPNADRIELLHLDQPAEPKAVVDFRHDPVYPPDYALSPDGRHLVRIVSWPRLAVQVWSFQEQRVVRIVDLNRQNGQPKVLGFTHPTRLVVYWRQATRSALELFEITTGQALRSVMLPEHEPIPSAIAMSPDARFFAVATQAEGGPQVQVFDLSTGRMLRRLPISGLDPQWPLRPSALSFSTDGQRIAAMFESNQNGMITVWRVIEGRRLAEHLYPAGPVPETGTRHYRGKRLGWVADDTAWVLYGQTLVEVETGRILGTLDLPSPTHQQVISASEVLLICRPTGIEPVLVRAVLDLERIKAAKGP